MAATKRERIDEFLKRLREASPFETAAEARVVLNATMTAVEDELSGVPNNPNAANSPATDGRMYPPDEKFEIASGSPRVRLFKQRGHRTWIGENGSVRITSVSGTVELDLPGGEGKTIDELLLETSHEPH